MGFALISRGLPEHLLVSIIPAVLLLLLLVAALLVWRKLKRQKKGERWEEGSVWV